MSTADVLFQSVEEVTAWCKAQDGPLDVGPGRLTKFTRKHCETTLVLYGECGGIAGNLMWVDLKRWAVSDQVPSATEVEPLANTRFSLQAVVAAGRVEWLELVIVAVFDSDPMPSWGGWRKLSMDRDIYGFILAWARCLRTTEMSVATEMCVAQAKTVYWEAARHIPITVVLFQAGPDLEGRLFAKGFQVLEDYRKKEEEYAATGWQVCSMMAAVRDMRKTESGDASVTGVETFFS